MNALYGPCPCNSGKKYKFCCHKQLQDLTPIEKAKVAIKYPMQLCVINDNWKEEGIGNIVVARKMPTGNCIVGNYLLDTWCLGIKSCHLRFNVTPQEILNEVRHHHVELSAMPMSYEDIRSLIFGGVAFSSQFGFFPYDPEWPTAREFLEPDRSFEQKFTYGKDGKLFYFAGPRDQDIAKRIIEKVREQGGDYMLPLG